MKCSHAAVLSAVLLLSTGCASSSRMMRFVPGGEDGSAPILGDVKEERANAWPLLNAGGGKVAVLWPLFDADKRGFAFRPLFNKEDSEYSALFPLSAWNPREGDGWCLLAYWDSKRSGFFPFAHFRKDGFNYIFPVFWNSQDGSFGTPLCYSSKRLSFAGPVWWRDDANGSATGFRGGFFPIFKESSSGGWLFPCYYRNVEPDSTTVFSLLGGAEFTKDGSTPFVDVMGPVFFKLDEGGVRSWSALFPLSFFQRSQDGKESLSFILPWYHRKEASGRVVDATLPFYWHDSDGSLLLPALLSSWSWRDKRESLDILFPFFHSSKGSLRLFPLVSWRDPAPCLFNRNADGYSLGGVFGYKLSERFGAAPSTAKSALELEALKERGVSENRRRSRGEFLLFPLYSSCEVEDAQPLLPSYRTSYATDNASFFLAFSERKRYKSVEGLDSRRLEALRQALEALSASEGKDEGKAATAKAKLAGLLKAQGLCGDGASDAELAKALAALDAKHAKFDESSSFLLPLLFSDEREEGKGKGSLLWFLSRWNSEGAKRRFSVLEYMYRYEADGSSSRMDAFPFLSVDRGPGAFRCSFLWRFASYGEDAGGKRLYALFIPLL